MSEDKIEVKVRETTYQLIEETDYVTSRDVADRLRIHRASAAQYLHHNYKKWRLIRRAFGENLSQKRWVYAKDPEKIPLVKHEKIVEEARREDMLRELESMKSKIETRIKEIAEQNILPAKEMKYKAEELLPKKTSLDEWILNLHKERGHPINFTNIKSSSQEYFGKKPDSDMIIDLLDHYQKLIKKGKLKFEGGLTYLTN